MVALADVTTSQFVKILYIGDSGTGKTGSLESLVAAGYKLRILDLDNGTPILKAFVLKNCPDKIGNVDVETRRDKYKSTAAGPMVEGIPKAFTQSMSLLTNWPDKTVPAEWGDEYIMVIDSFTGISNAAFEWAKAMSPSAKDPRQWYKAAQDALQAVLSLLTNEQFRAHVIVICHVELSESPEGSTKGYAKSIGKALGPIIPTYFNTMVLTSRSGTGASIKRSIETMPTALIDLKNPVPFKVDAKYPLETGLATLFKTLKEN